MCRTKTQEAPASVDLVGIVEIANMLVRITQSGIRNLTFRDDFPVPIAELIGGEVWHRGEIMDWISAHPEALADVFRGAEMSSPTTRPAHSAPRGI